MDEKTVVSKAKSYVGYLEKRSSKDLDSKTANAGNANYTRFGRDYKVLTGSNLQASPWCATFLSVCFAEAYGYENAKKLLCGGLFASCTVGRRQFKNKGRYYSTPKAGDIVMFKRASGRTELVHTGLVTKVSGGYIYTIEGNTSGEPGVVANGGSVAEKRHKTGYSRIDGYCRPDYAQKEDAGGVDKVTIELEQVSKGSKGEIVSTVQRLLIALGFKGKDGKVLSVDGSFGGNTEFAVKSFQRARNVEVDGYVGKDTWTELLCG